MAQWSYETKHPLSGINGGNQYEQGDHVSRQELNAIVENSAYATRVAENAQSATENGVSYNEQSPTTAEKEQVRENIGLSFTDLLDFFYPVYSIFQTTSSDLNTVEKMQAHFGGTWERFAEGKTIYGAGTNENNNIVYTVGTDKEAGLPNISGKATTEKLLDNVRASAGTNGAITTEQTGTIALASGGGTQGLYSLSIDASKNSAIYGNSQTVQPEATVVYIYRRIA